MATDSFENPERVEEVDGSGMTCRVRRTVTQFAVIFAALALLATAGSVLFAARQKEQNDPKRTPRQVTVSSTKRAAEPIVSGEVESLTIWSNPPESSHSNSGTDIARTYPGSRIDIYENFLVVNTPEDGRIVSPNGSYSNLKLKP